MTYSDSTVLTKTDHCNFRIFDNGKLMEFLTNCQLQFILSRIQNIKPYQTGIISDLSVFNESPS